MTTAPDWRQEMETTRLARNAVHDLRKALDAGAPTPDLSASDLAALVEEFDRMRALISTSWHRAADKLADTPHNATALTGPHWYVQGWDDAVRQLRDLADYMEPAPRPSSTKEQP